jgi:hypothetical protein
MKNLFKKQDSTGALIAYLSLAAIAAGTITYLYLKRKSALKRIETQVKEHAGDYLQHKNTKKRRTTDVHDLGKIIGKSI